MICEKSFFSNRKTNGFTIFEVVVSISILIILIAIAVPNFLSFNENYKLKNSAEEFLGILRLAQNKTISSESYKQYGVYLDSISVPSKYILFQGNSYIERETSYDQVYNLPDSIEFYDINIGNNNEIIFEKITGETENFGSVSMRIKSNVEKNETIFIYNSGSSSLSFQENISEDNRVKDSRHIHIYYNRTINTEGENIILTLNNNQTEIIQINSYLVSGEIYWRGTINVGGSDQVLEIKTHGLNNPNTLFSIHRDRRYNNKSLKVEISGDNSGYLAEYSADGLITNFTSSYVSNFQLQ